MSAYYNEFDPEAAAWLRELIKRNLIAPGEVDERSIEDIKPSDLRGFTQCHFFAGIGVWSLALRNAGWPDEIPIWTGSCPCQPFSTAGKGEGLADERHLWPAFHWLIKQCEPSTVIGEQVAGKDGIAWLDIVATDLEREGYTSGAVVFPACGVGAPHLRQRQYWLAYSERQQCEKQLPRPLQSDKEKGSRPTIESSGLCNAGQLDDASSEGLEEQRGRREKSPLPGQTVSPSQLANSSGEHGSGDQSGEDSMDSRGEAVEHGNGETDSNNAHRCGAAGELANDNGGGLDKGGECESAARRDGAFRDGPTSEIITPGPLNGRWKDADWLLCRDGKWRPVEPGSFPLANGTPARVGRLRGYGNAIVEPQARAFIEIIQEIILK